MTLRALALVLVLTAVASACGDDRSAARAGSGTARGATTTPSNDEARDATRNSHADAGPVVPDVALERDLADEIDALRDRRSRADERLTAAVRSLTNRDLEVHCWPPEAWARVDEIVAEGDLRLAGTVDPFEYKIDLAHDFCDTARALDGGDRAVAAAEALYILAHEAGHLVLGSNEATASCYGIQRMDELAVELGVSETEARELSELAWEELYPAQPDGYKARECRPGGVLDDDPDDPEWP